MSLPINLSRTSKAGGTWRTVTKSTDAVLKKELLSGRIDLTTGWKLELSCGHVRTVSSVTFSQAPKKVLCKECKAPSTTTEPTPAAKRPKVPGAR